MVSIIIIAAILLFMRLVSAGFILSVIRKQWKLLHKPIDPDLRTFQYALFVMSCIIFAGNGVPIVIDTVTLFVETSRPETLGALSISYAMSNAITAMVSAILIWFMYKIAENSTKE